MRGIILAGGKGTRLNPLTLAVSKQALPVYDKPMIYYPLSILMLLNIRDILIISTPEDIPLFKKILKDGKQWGMSFEYVEQAEPRGLAEAFILGKEFIGDDSCCMILGDNIFYGHGLLDTLRNASKIVDGAHIFAYEVQDPERYGIIELDSRGNPISIEEKPHNPRSNYAIPGIYFFDNKVSGYAETLAPSKRGEIEIVDLQKIYLSQNKLRVSKIGRGVAWLDVGTHESLLQAANFVYTIQERQGMMISSPEEIAYNMDFIPFQEFREIVLDLPENQYKKNLMKQVAKAYQYDD